MSGPSATFHAYRLVLMLPEAVLRYVEDVHDQHGPPIIVPQDEHSNDLTEIRFNGGPTLMVKRARSYPESADARFRTCRRASRLLREEVGVVAPEHLDIPTTPAEPVMAYTRIELPTLAELWPDVSERARARVLRDWGRLIGRMHQVRLPGHGPLIEAEQGATRLAEFLTWDLAERLRPAVGWEWKTGAPVLDRLLGAIPEIAARVEERGDGAVLNHNDLHMANVLCRVEEGEIHCVGFLDLEAALAGPPEADLAKIGIYHGPLFGKPLAGAWFDRVWEGYGSPLDPLVLAFFRAYHLVNIGFHMAFTGNKAHAGEIARAAQEEVDALG